ncbi:MAG: ATP synthase F1 subunit gamma [Lachnospiraceae bacterium]|nr:ATP synthase F1 subunit gamma [Lachnospiraceae bacterium]
MPSLNEIKDRIESVKETRKITNAMYMISSNKLRQAKKMLAETEPYFFATQKELARIMKYIPKDTENVYLNTYSEIAPEDRRKGYIVVSDDKGLAGAYNHNVLALAESMIPDPGTEYFYVVGEVGRQYFKSRGIEIDGDFQYAAQKPTISLARSIAYRLLEHYEKRQLEEVYIIYTAMKGPLSTEVKVDRLLPLKISYEREEAESRVVIESDEDGKKGKSNMETLLLMDPSPSAVLDNIVPPCVSGLIYGALVESFCSAQNSRMLAMDAANKNASEIVKELERTYNRTRQAGITQEITEVVGGSRKRERKK